MSEPASVPQDWQSKPRTHCPQCGAVLELTLLCKAVAILPTTEDGTLVSKSAQRQEALSMRQGTEAEQDVLAAARRAGLLEPFYQTARFVKRDQVPKDLDGFFLTVLRGLTQRLIPSYAMAEFNRLFDFHPLEYHTAQGIGVVIVDGYLRLFVPNAEVVGTPLRRLNNHGSKLVKRTLKLDDGKAKLREWIHTRWGYVAGPGALYEHLRKRSYGDFARPSLHEEG
jgi:hypothetical protein